MHEDDERDQEKFDEAAINMQEKSQAKMRNTTKPKKLQNIGRPENMVQSKNMMQIDSLNQMVSESEVVDWSGKNEWVKF